MENILSEIVFSSSSPKISRQITALQKEGKLIKIASRIYTSNLKETPESIIRRNLFQILAHQYPDAVLSHRSAFEYKPTSKGNIFLTYTYTKKVELPGVTISFLKGHGPIPGDNPIAGKLYVSQQERALLENLQVSKRLGPDSKTLTLPEIEEKLETVINVHGEEGLNKLRDTARKIAEELNMKDEFEKLNKIISSLLTTNASKGLKSPVALARALGIPYDKARLQLFEVLFRELQQREFPNYPEKNITPQSFRNFAFFESYFSNYIEGTIFELDDAKKIIATQTPMAARDEDSHDVLGTYQLVSNRDEMNLTPKTPEELLHLLLNRHKILLSARPHKKPGQFKDKNNRAGNTHFVDLKLVRGTLTKGFEFSTGLTHPFAKAIYIMFLVSEVHPFLDGNGRVARVMMNAELVKENQSKIIIPTVFRDDYMGALKKLTNQSDASTFIRMMERAREFSKNIYDEDMNKMQKYLEDCEAFKEDNEGKLKIIPGENATMILKEFTLKNKHSFLEINKIILTPKFQWSNPNDWSKVLIQQHLMLNITCYDNNGGKRFKPYSINTFNDPYYSQAVFPLIQPINIPGSIWEGQPSDDEFPIKVTIELTARMPSFEFDVALACNETL
ncbi:MAG: Fic family protein [Bacteroidia bacterium]